MTKKRKESFWAAPPVKITASFTCAFCKKELDPFDFAKLSNDEGFSHILCIPKGNI